MPITPVINQFLIYVTELGNNSVLLALTVFASFWLIMVGRYWHAAASLWIAFIVTSLISVFAKLIFMGCIEDTVFGIHSPSGHAALTLATYGMLGLLFAQATRGFFRALINIVIIFLIIIIAFSRVILGFHTIEEVIFGVLAGFIGLAIAYAYFFNWKMELLRFNVPLMLIILASVAYILHGTNIPAENWLKQMAAELKNYVPSCQDGNTSRENSSS